MCFFTPATMVSCSEDSDAAQVIENVLDFLLSMMGFDFDAEKESLTDETSGEVYDDDSEEVQNLSSKVDMSAYFPPIGNQGSYGTCVAWSTGYGLKTALDAMSNGYSSSQLQSTSRQCSPVDLWHLIPTDGKSTNCDGSNFEPALQALIDNGVSTMASVPFTNSKMTCDGITGKGGSNKLMGYRVIAYSSELSGSSAMGMNVSNFKYYLNAGYPILIGAQLGEKFMAWEGSSVISSDTKDYNGQHAYHAMVVTGYDDSKGTNGAFRVRNSWGADDWGDDGCIWVDYKHFINQFVFGAWVAWNDADKALGSNSTSSATVRAGSANDLTAHVYSDVENADGTRTLTYDIENTGNSTISATKNWSVSYMLFKNRRINEKAVLFHDQYSDDEQNKVAIYNSENAISDVDVEPGQTVAQAMGGKKLQFTYRLPKQINGEPLTGKYYMVLVVNCFNSFEENNFNNNYSFVTGSNNAPLILLDGKISNMPTTLKDVRTLVSDNDKNNYSGAEMMQILTSHNKCGKLKKEVQAESSSLRSTKAVKKVVK